MPYASEEMRTQRQRLGVKATQFAKRLPLSESHYKNLEGGSKPAAIEMFYLVARELGISPDDIGVLIADPPDQPRSASDGQTGPTACDASSRGAA